jgi:hypothetical protein
VKEMPGQFIGGVSPTGSEQEWQNNVQSSYYSANSVDVGSGAGVTVPSNTMLTAYQIIAANTYITNTNATLANANIMLPLTSGPNSLRGVQLYIANVSANPLNCFLYQTGVGTGGDASIAGAGINGLSVSTPVVLGANTITEFTCFAPGIWLADGIGEGFAGSLATVVSQGSVAAAGSSSQSAATPITQAMALVTNTAANQGVALPAAKAGMQVTLNPTGVVGNTPLLVWPINGGSDAINPGGANASFSVTLPVTAPIIFMCFVNGTWFTK